MKLFKTALLFLLTFVLVSNIVFAPGLVNISPSKPIDTENLTCNINGVSGSARSNYQYKWYVNGVKQTVTGSTPWILAASRSDVDDDVTCSVFTPLNFFVGLDTVTINPVPPVNRAPNIEITIPNDGADFNVNQPVSFTAAGTDPDGDTLTYTWNFGDGSSTISGGSGASSIRLHTYANPGNYRITATVSDGSLTDSDSINIDIVIPLQPPIADAGPDQGATAGVAVNFDGSGSTDADGTIVSYEWDFGDGTTGSGVATSHTYMAIGTYTATLTVTDNDGLQDTDTTVITISMGLVPPVADAGPDQNGIVSQVLTFDGSNSNDPDGTIVNYVWDFGDGNTDTGNIVTHSYSNTGVYTVTLTVTDNNGLMDSDTAIMDITTGLISPVANIQPDTQTIPVGGTANLDASSSTDADGTIVNYVWDFGDGTTGSGVTASHVYPTMGTYTVTLTVTDNNGLMDSDTAIVIVTTGLIPPIADAGIDRSVVVGNSINFDGSGSTDADGTIVNYQWDFGDGNTGTGVNTNHIYLAIGTYTVTLTVTDNDGLQDTDTAIITVLDTTSQPPIANAGSDQNGIVSQVLTFDGSNSNDPDGTIVNYVWDFGDGSPVSNGITTTHFYSTVGTYTVTLTVTDNDGLMDSGVAIVTITQGGIAPIAIINAPNEGFAGFSVTFDGSGSSDADGTIVSYEWDFADGTTGSGPILDHKFTSIGTYTVTLTVTDNDGLQDTDIHIINIKNVDRGNPPDKQKINPTLTDKDIQIGRVMPLENKQFYRKGENVMLLVKLVNEGSDNEKVDLELSIPEFGSFSNVNGINLETSQVKWVMVNMNIPKSASPGLHLAKLTLDPRSSSSFNNIKYWQFVVA